MFERSERQIVPGPDLYGAVGRIQEGLFRDGQVLLQQVSPTSWVGKGPVVGLGFLMKVTLVAYPMPSGAFAFDAKIEAELEDMGIIWLGVSWFVCFPIAAILFFLAWKDASNRQRSLFSSTWGCVFGALQGHAPPPMLYR